MSTAAGVSAVLLPRGISFFGNTAPIDPDAAGPFPNDFDRNLIWAPEKPAEWPAFREALSQWRNATRRSLGFDDSLYRRPDFAWVPASFSCCFLMMCDEEFFNLQTNDYTHRGFLDKGLKEFGGFDIVVLWHAYPRDRH